jgi:hypothetical protein
MNYKSTYFSGLTQMRWLAVRKSELSTLNKLLLCKQYSDTSGLAVFNSGEPVHNQNREILERFQCKTLRVINDAPWHVTNKTIRKDLQIPSTKEDIGRK